MGPQARTLPQLLQDLIIWYARDRAQYQIPTRCILPRTIGDVGAEEYTNVEMPDGSIRPLDDEELEGSKGLARLGLRCSQLILSYQPATGLTQAFPSNGMASLLKLHQTKTWKTSIEGMIRLCEKGRVPEKEGLQDLQSRYFDDFPHVRLNNIWTDFVRGASLQVVCRANLRAGRPTLCSYGYESRRPCARPNVRERNNSILCRNNGGGDGLPSIRAAFLLLWPATASDRDLPLVRTTRRIARTGGRVLV